MRNAIILSFIALLLPLASLAEASHDKLIGKGKLNYMIWHVYNAELYSKDGSFSFDKPFSLKLIYKRNLDGEAIADRSAEEIRKLGYDDEMKLAAWHNQMKKLFPDVNDGTTLTGIFKPDEPTVFFKDGEKIGQIEDPKFGKWFFSIWLDENTSEPELRNALLGN